MQFFFRFCAGDIDEYMDIFLDTKATKEVVIQAGIAIFQYIYHVPDTTLGEIRYNMFSRNQTRDQQRVQLHSMHSVPTLQTRDWILLESMSLNPSDYGWTLVVHGYEPVPTLDPMAPEGLLKFTSCNCHGDRSDWRCTPVAARRMGSCPSQPVESAKALHAKTVVIMLLSLKKIDNDS